MVRGVVMDSNRSHESPGLMRLYLATGGVVSCPDERKFGYETGGDEGMLSMIIKTIVL